MRPGYSTSYKEGQAKDGEWDHKRLESASAIARDSLGLTLSVPGTQSPPVNEQSIMDNQFHSV